MSFTRISARTLPTRVATGVYILHSGWEKWHGDDERARGIHAMASGAFPFLADVPPARFLRALSVAEMGIGAALLAPFVPDRLAGAPLTAFAGALMTMYLRTPCAAPTGERVARARPGSPSARTCGCSGSAWGSSRIAPRPHAESAPGVVRPPERGSPNRSLTDASVTGWEVP